MSKDTDSQHSEASPQHTPGPWRVVHGLYPDGEVEVQGGGANLTGPIASLDNANLIAAAPDLLAALKLMMTPGDVETDEGYALFERQWNAAHAAVDKAEGRQP